MRQAKSILDPRKAEDDYKPQLPPQVLSQLQLEFKRYCAAVLGSGLSETSKGIYIDFADKFVRWLAGEFTPGQVKDGRPFKRMRTDRD